ncbi:MAG TPA: hypothetical protein VKZ82_20470 [Nonomuraea sp.]|nr:hypothetical protein [Nonomuraea sp.]
MVPRESGGGEGVLIPLTAALGVAGLALVVLPHVSEYLNGQLHRLIYDRLFRAVNADPGLSRFENPAFHDELRLAHEAGQNAPQQIVGSTLTICQGVLTPLGFAATLTVLSPVMVVVAALCCAGCTTWPPAPAPSGTPPAAPGSTTRSTPCPGATTRCLDAEAEQPGAEKASGRPHQRPDLPPAGRPAGRGAHRRARRGEERHPR